MAALGSRWLILLVPLFFLACSKEKEPFKDAPNCVHNLDVDSTKVIWKAYKFSERVSVTGHFDSLSIQSPEKATIAQLLTGTQISFPLASVRTDLLERDDNIRKFFVAGIAEQGRVHAQVQAVQGSSVWVVIRLNGRQQVFPMTWSVDSGALLINGKIELDSFALTENISRLSQGVAPMHTGSDGLSKMWPDIDLTIQSPLHSHCQD